MDLWGRADLSAWDLAEPEPVSVRCRNTWTSGSENVRSAPYGDHKPLASPWEESAASSEGLLLPGAEKTKCLVGLQKPISAPARASGKEVGVRAAAGEGCSGPRMPHAVLLAEPTMVIRDPPESLGKPITGAAPGPTDNPRQGGDPAWKAVAKRPTSQGQRPNVRLRRSQTPAFFPGPWSPQKPKSPAAM